VDAGDVKDWREDNKYTWHELNDLESMKLIPSKINGTYTHLVGVGEHNIKENLGMIRFMVSNPHHVKVLT
jgi:hypothetical protein